MGAWSRWAHSSGRPGCFTPLRHAYHWLNLFPPLPSGVQGGQWNLRPLDADRKRQRHQLWCNPNQMQPQTHGVVTVGLAKAQRQEIVLKERSLGWDQPGGAVPLRLLTLLSPRREPRTRGRGSLWFWPQEEGSRHQPCAGHCAGGAHNPGTMAGRGHQVKGRGQSEPSIQDSQNPRPRALALALAPAGRPKPAEGALLPSGWLLG